MFKQNISFEVWGGENGKYRLLDDDKNPIDKTPEDTCNRVAKALSDLELPEKREFWYKEFKSILGTRFAGGGRIMANVGAGQYKKETSPINCFVKGTMVATSEGNKKIEDIKIGDLVLTHNGRFKKVLQTFCNPLADRTVFAIKAFRTPEIKVTGNHKFLSLSKEQMDWGYTDPQWNSIEYLRTGDYIAIPNNSQELDYAKQINVYDEIVSLPSIDVDWFEIQDLGDRAQISTIKKNNSKKNLQKHQAVNKIWNIDEDFAFFLGLWYGDGCVYSTNSDDPKLRGITFTFHANEKENINFVANYGEKLFGLKADVNDNSESDNSVQIRFHSTLIGYVFNKLFGRYFDKKFMYKDVYKWPTNLYYKLLAGLISSDGTITGAGDIRAVLANRQLIMDFYITGRMNNVPVGYSETEDTRNHYPTARLDVPRYNDLIDLVQRVYDDDRIQIARDRGDDTFIKKYGGYTLVKLNIKKTVNITDDNVYTLEVEDDHSYTVSGLICQNCTVLKQIPDSLCGIMDVAKDAALTLKAGCGVGYDFSTIRPKDSHVFGAGAGTSGVISFMKIFDAICSTILSGGARRGAQMACLDIQSPEIEDFITAKRQDGVLRYFNCSVLVTDRFMQAVENDKVWDLWFWEKERKDPVNAKEICLIKRNDIPYNHSEFKYFKFAEDHCEVQYGNCTVDTIFKKRIFKTVKAKELFELIMKSTYNFWEPGFLLIDRINIENNLYFDEIIRATNPCFAPDTLIAVADGRHAVSIKQLAEEGKDVAVYSVDADGKVSIKMGRNPRITGYDRKLVRVILDDESFIDVTPNHKFMLMNGKEVEAKDLRKGDSLPRFTKRPEPITPKSVDKNYYRILCDTNDSYKDKPFEHRMIAQFFFPEKWKELYDSAKNNGWAKTGGLVVHHKDFDKLNNSPDNLEIMTFKAHQEYHAQFGQRGEDNGRYCGVSSEDVKKHGLILAQLLGRRFSTEEWEKYAKNNGLPQTFSSFRRDTLGTVKELAKLCASELGYENTDLDPRIVKTYQKMLKEGYIASIKNNTVYVEKQCEQCGSRFEIKHAKREISFCSHSCSSTVAFANQEYRDLIKNITQTRASKVSQKNKPLQAKIYSDLKFKLNREPLLKEWQDECKQNGIVRRLGKTMKYGFKNFEEVKRAGDEYNHKVVSVVELDGKHTVYNITVDDNHTVGIITDVKDGKRGAYYSGVYVRQCGEIPLQFSGACLLGSMILPTYIKSPFESLNFDFEKYRKDIRIVSRFLDNVVEINNLPLVEMQEQISTKRRHGLGFTGLGSVLNMLCLSYGSPDAIAFTEKISLILAQESLYANIELAKEKGYAPIFATQEARKAVLESVYLKRLIDSCENKEQIIKDILEFGLRYSHATSIAPTGTMSITWGNNCSGGIEPEIADSYFRNIRNPNKKTKTQEEVMSYSYFMWKQKNGDKPLPDYWRTTKDLSAGDHLRMQSVVQKWMDNSISKTINVPFDYPFEDFKNIYLEGWKLGLKGVTTYRPNASIGAGVLTQKSDLDATTYTFTLEDGREVSFLGSETVEYDGESHNVANLFDAMKEGIYGSM